MLENKRILVTGGAGFLGGYVLDALRARGAGDVVAPTSRECDLVVRENVRRLFDEVRPELVLHVAAKNGGLGAQQASPGAFFHDNLMMGAHVLEEARLHGTAKVVTIGTMCEYPEHAPLPLREDDLWSGYPDPGTAPYGLAKRMLHVQGQAYRQQYGMNIVHLIPVNLYGPRYTRDPSKTHVTGALISRFVEAADTGAQEVSCWGDGSPTREFLHVAEAAEAIVLAADRYDGAAPVNLGTGVEISVKALAHLIADASGYRGQIRWDTTKPSGQARRTMDVSRAETQFGFRAQKPLKEGISETVAWFRSLR